MIRTMTNNHIVINVKNLIAYYMTANTPIRAVDNVTFYVNEKEIFGIVGESGCGKSTLAATILRLLKPPGRIIGGEVLFDGIDLLRLSETTLREIRWRKISYIPQGSMNSLNPIMRVRDQIIDGIMAHLTTRERRELSKGKLKDRVKELLVSVGLAPEVADMYPHELSGGMRQRVAIAMAISLNPKLIIADEPTTALDVVIQRGILQLLSDIKEKLGSSFILITHDIAVQAEVSDRIGVMYAGKIVEVSPTRELFRDPLHPYSQALISAVPSLSESRVLKGLPGSPPDLRQPPSGCRFHPRCPHAISGLCNRIEPPLLEVKDRLIACHLYR